MTPIYTHDTLRQMFQSAFQLSDWYSLLQYFFHATELKKIPESLHTPHEEEKGYYLGNIETPDNFRVGLFCYQIHKGSVTNRRVGLRNLVKSFINPQWGEFDAALVVYDSHDHWRLSFICDIKEESTAPKRYTYVFGSKDLLYRTPIERLIYLQKKGISFENLKTAFSVEALSDEFFDRYREQYADFIQYVTGKRFVKSGNKWVEKTVGSPNAALMQAFGYDEKKIRDYIKKMMGRITFLHFLQRKGWMNGDLNYMQHLFERSHYQDDYLDSVLEPLFFGILNTRPSEREDLFHQYGWDKSLLAEWKNIPYLNGGLFERDTDDEPESVFPADYFRKLFQFFSEYNFTIDENDPNDAEVGVDPEMLGKIFENLLEDNKDKGAFYTPKEIVRYMCQESLIAYLETHTTLAKDKVRAFVLSPEESVTDIPDNKKAKLLTTLEEIKICDPAIGSGAFPMGLLNALLHCREALSGEHYDRAELKKQIIQRNIYGVDIEKGAVDIARLRFWLSIVVDEETPSPLPNLDYKIMQGNSLIESFMGVDLSKLTYEKEHKKDKGEISLFDNEKNRLQKTVSQLLAAYYSCTDHSRKVRLQQEISDTINRQLEAGLVDQAILAKLKDINLAENNQFFLWHTWFSDVFNREEGKSGFDIVIGNPPYISYYSRQAVSIDEKLLEAIKSDISYISNKKKRGRYHSVQFFIYRGVKIFNSRGICNFIIDLSFFEKPFADLRHFILSKYYIKEIVSGLTAFKNVSSGQLIISITSQQQNHLFTWKEDLNGIPQYIDVLSCLTSKDYCISRPNPYSAILEKIEKNSYNLSQICEVRTGVNIGGVKSFFLCDNENYPPYISGGNNVQLYHINYPTELQKRRKETHFKFNKNIEKYIWGNNLGTPSIGENNERFIRPKLIIRQSDTRITAAIDLYNKYHCGYTLFTVNIPNDNEKDLLCLLGIINSRLITFYMLNKGWIKLAAGKNPQIRIEDIKRIPISHSFHSPTFFKEIVECVSSILKINDTKLFMEKLTQIDKLIYKLYDLEDNEINIIEKWLLDKYNL